MPSNELTPSQKTKTKERNIKARQEALREQLKGQEYLRQIESDYNSLDALVKKIGDLKAKKLGVRAMAATGRVYDTEMLNIELSKCIAQRDVLKIKIDTNFKRLKFVLPELKSMTLTDPDGNNPFGDFAALMAKATKESAKG